MPIYNISENGIFSIPRTDFQSQGILERNHLQQFLKDKIEIISKDTLIISEEFSDWDESKKRIDLLGIDKNANLIVIELKRTDTGDHMELQALRYASMVSIMSFEKCITIYQNYIDKNNLNKDAKQDLIEFLEWDDSLEEDFALDVKIILASANFSKELTTSVMWLISKGIDIKCIKLSPYNFNGKILLDVDQIIPLPEAESYLIKIKEKDIERQKALQTKKDNTKYEFNGKIVGKGRLVSEVVKYYQKNHKHLTFDQLQKVFLPPFQGSIGVINRLDDVNEKYAKDNNKRHFIDDDDILISADNVKFVVSSQWGIGNIHNIITWARKENYEIIER